MGAKLSHSPVQRKTKKEIERCTRGWREVYKRQAYAIYRQYGLTYDRESDRLYYEGELVNYFEDEALKHFFGPFDDSPMDIQAVRDSQGTLTGLDIRNSDMSSEGGKKP